MFYITFNGKMNRALGVEVTTRPSIPAPDLRGEYTQVAGRDGSLLVTDGTYENIQIDVDMNFVRPEAKVGTSYRAVKNWLQGSGILRMSDDSEVFYRVKACGITANERASKVGSKFTASFICDPFTYYNSGASFMDVENAKLNPYMECWPVYYITGNGQCTLTVNGNEMTAMVGQNLTIDTEKMLAYQEDGTLQNTAVTGDYEALALLPGENEIGVTSGFTLKVKPNYRSL